MYQTALKTTQLGQTGLEITRVGFGAWAIGGGDWEFGWGPQDDERVDRRDPPRARAGDQLDRHRRRLRVRPLRADRRPRAGRPRRAAVRVHQVLAAGRPRPHRRAQPQARLDPARGRATACSGSGSTRSTSTRSTGRSRRRTSRRAGRRSPSSRSRASCATSASPTSTSSSCAQIQQIAPVETLQPQYSLIEREAERELLPFAEREGIGVIVYSPMGSGMLTGGMTRERIESLPDDDWRKRDVRFNEPQLSREPRAGRAPEGGRRALRHHAGRGRGRLDAAQPRRRRRDRRASAGPTRSTRSCRRRASSSPTQDVAEIEGGAR